MMLTDQQIDFIEAEIKARGISVPDLAESLLDHFCCAIEFEMKQGLSFENAWRKTYLQVSPDGLEEINREVQHIIYQKHHNMKKFVFILGFASAFIFTVGYWFKVAHWPTANFNMVLGSTLFALAFLPMYFLLKYSTDKSLGRAKKKASYILSFALALVICIGIPYKLLELPGENIFFLANCIIFSLIFLPRVFLNWYKDSYGLPVQANS